MMSAAVSSRCALEGRHTNCQRLPPHRLFLLTPGYGDDVGALLESLWRERLGLSHYAPEGEARQSLLDENDLNDLPMLGTAAYTALQLSVGVAFTIFLFLSS